MKMGYETKEMIKTIALFAIVALCAIFLGILQGCAGKMHSVKVGQGLYEVPVASSDERVQVAGEDQKDRVATVVVPASDKPTTIRIYKRNISMVRRILTYEPEIKAISDNSATSVQVPQRTVWWKWVLLLGFFIAVLRYIIKRFFSISLCASAWGLVSRYFKRNA